MGPPWGVWSKKGRFTAYLVCGAWFWVRVPPLGWSWFWQILAFQGSWKAFQRPSKSRNLLPLGSRPGFGPKGRVPGIPEGRFSCRLQATKVPKSGSKRLLARIWPKKAVSQGSQKAVLIARLQATKVPKSGSKRLLARIWPKRAVSKGSQKAILIAVLQATRIPKSGSKRLLARIWPKRAVSQGSQKAVLIAVLQATRIRKSGSKRLLARILPKRAVSKGSQKAALISTVPSYLRAGTGVAQAKPSGLRPSGFWQCPSSFLRGTMPSYLRPATGVANAKPSGLRSRRF